MLRHAVVGSLLVLGACYDSDSEPQNYGSTGSDAPPAAATAGYHVEGNRIVDSFENGVILHGVDRPSLEWSESGEHFSQADFTNMASWGAKVVRIGLNQCYWLSITTERPYQMRVQQVVSWAESANLAVILDLHWSNPPENTATGAKCAQQAMADTNSITFWQQVATAYYSDPHVTFELYNEPFMGESSPGDAEWSTWQNGGSYDATDNSQNGAYSGVFQTVGMQQLYDAVRGTGANNLVIIGGLNWAYDLSGVPTHAISGTNIAYATHPYSFKENFSYVAGGAAPSNWDTMFGNLAQSYAVIATEFGDSDCTTDYYNVFTTYAQSKGVSWTAWAWYWGGWPDANSGSACGFPTIIADWNGTPNDAGAVVKSAMPVGTSLPPVADSGAPDSTPDSQVGDSIDGEPAFETFDSVSDTLGD